MIDEGDYKAVFFENDGYTIFAETLFKVQKTAPDTPQLVSSSPENGSKNADPAIAFSAVIRNGGTSLNPESVKLSLNNQDAKVDITASDDAFNTISFTGEGLFEAGSSHKFKLEFSDDGDPVTSETVLVDFDVASYPELEMPEPIYFANFDSVEEFELPEGWEGVNLSQEINAELEPDDFTSAYYEGWVNVAMTRWSNSGSATQKATEPAPPIFVNDTRQVLTGNALGDGHSNLGGWPNDAWWIWKDLGNANSAGYNRFIQNDPGAMRHGGKSNYVFGDGRAKLLDPNMIPCDESACWWSAPRSPH